MSGRRNRQIPIFHVAITGDTGGDIILVTAVVYTSAQ
jgi:hypothetical protein